MPEVLLDAAGRPRSPATLPGFHARRAPRNKRQHYPGRPTDRRGDRRGNATRRHRPARGPNAGAHHRPVTGALNATGSIGASNATAPPAPRTPRLHRRLERHRLPAGQAPAGRAALRGRPTLHGFRDLAAGAAGSGPGRWRPWCPPAARQWNRHRRRGSARGAPCGGPSLTLSMPLRTASGPWSIVGRLLSGGPSASSARGRACTRRARASPALSRP
jgi:hypothetical protein